MLSSIYYWFKNRSLNITYKRLVESSFTRLSQEDKYYGNKAFELSLTGLTVSMKIRSREKFNLLVEKILYFQSDELRVDIQMNQIAIVARILFSDIESRSDAVIKMFKWYAKTTFDDELGDWEEFAELTFSDEFLDAFFLDYLDIELLEFNSEVKGELLPLHHGNFISQMRFKPLVVIDGMAYSVGEQDG